MLVISVLYCVHVPRIVLSIETRRANIMTNGWWVGGRVLTDQHWDKVKSRKSSN